MASCSLGYGLKETFPKSTPNRLKQPKLTYGIRGQEGGETFGGIDWNRTARVFCADMVCF